jgi:dTDP-3-amino-3,4,6-trideoxy-alpha-D-glucose transaminase
MFAIAAERIASSGSILLGPELSAFEHELASSLHAAEAVGVSSGASALQLALAALGVGAGDEVILPAFTAVPTASAVAATGARPVLLDVDSRTACLDVALIDASRTARTKAVIVVHLYGYPSALPTTDLPIIEDAAQAHGALTSPAASAATAYSFYPTKNLGGIGDGGAVVTDDAQLAAKVRQLRVHGMTAQYVHESISQNYRMSELEAAWLRLGLAELPADVSRRREIARHQRQAAPGLRWQPDHRDHAYHLSVFRTPQREAAQALLGRRGVGTAVHYPLAVTQQPAYTALSRAMCPNAEAWAAECVSVPCFPEMTDAEVEQVSAALAELAVRQGSDK